MPVLPELQACSLESKAQNIFLSCPNKRLTVCITITILPNLPNGNSKSSCQSKICQLQFSRFVVDQQVLRLQVSMKDIATVTVRKAPKKLEPEKKREKREIKHKAPLSVQIFLCCHPSGINLKFIDYQITHFQTKQCVGIWSVSSQLNGTVKALQEFVPDSPRFKSRQSLVSIPQRIQM